MQQRINFLPLLTEGRSGRFFLDVTQMSVLYAAFVAILVIISSVHLWQGRQVVRQLKIANADIAVTQKTITTLLAEYPELDTGNAAIAMRAAYEKQHAFITALMPGPAFSDVMRGLSAAVNPGVWLTRITMTGQGAEIDLYGKATYEVAIQQFLDRLNQQRVFAGQHFQVFELTGPGTDKTEGFTFRIGTGIKNQ